ncbi:MAG: TauD/TfdA family dioxygenase [Alphaproteobacteria bacterium]|nr:TauD/TfdA family dioxygenase [Alphaproteobacteria bacterium]
MQPTALLHRKPAAPPPARAEPVADAGRLWTAATLDPLRESLFFDLPAATLAEIEEAIAHCRANGLTLETMEQEDFRLPSFAPHVAGLRHKLDTGAGILVLRGLPVDRHDDATCGMIAWGLANYLGRPLRQGLSADRRLFTVTDTGGQFNDPTRIGATSGESYPHTDNGCLEARPPDYIGLLCVQNALAGGESWVISAATIHNEMLRRRPDLVPPLYHPFHFRPPKMHAWPSGPRTVSYPIFDPHGAEMRIHYARVMVEPGMEMAGTPLSPAQREALDVLDGVIGDPALGFRYMLQPGEFLFVNNLVNLHGRAAYKDQPGAGRRRVLKRIWLWRRHVGPGTDPALLDLAELH